MVSFCCSTFPFMSGNSRRISTPLPQVVLLITATIPGTPQLRLHGNTGFWFGTSRRPAGFAKRSACSGPDAAAVAVAMPHVSWKEGRHRILVPVWKNLLM